MLSRLFQREPPTLDFPERAHLTHLTDKEATAALELLRLLVTGGQADVYQQPYTPAGEPPRWTVWIKPWEDGPGRSYALEIWVRTVLLLLDQQSA